MKCFYPEEKDPKKKYSMLDPKEIDDSNRAWHEISEKFFRLPRKGRPPTNSLYQLEPGEMDDILTFD